MTSGYLSSSQASGHLSISTASAHVDGLAGGPMRKAKRELALIELSA